MKSLAILLLAMTAVPAVAGGSKSPTPAPTTPDPAPTSTSSADASADAAATAAADASSRAVAAQQQRQEQAQSQDASSTVYGDTSRYTSRAYALALPGLTAAPAVAGECLEHTRGGGFLGGGVTGGTKLQKQCLNHVQCMDRADRLAAWGQIELAVRELQACGAVGGDITQPAAPPPEQADLHRFVPREELEQRLAEAEERNQRRFERVAGK